MSRRVPLRIVCLGREGPWSRGILGPIVSRPDVVGLVLSAPAPTPRAGIRGAVARLARRLGLRGGPALAESARQRGIPLHFAEPGADARLCEWLHTTRPDLLCMAGYPRMLPAAVLELAAGGTLNLHGSLLPRHRGLLPLFWVYYHDDREAGVTVHWATDRADAGAVVARDALPLPRGFPAEALNRRNTERGGALLAAALEAVVQGTASGTPQDERLATLAPGIRAGSPMVDFGAWEAERVWHFLAALFPRFREPLKDSGGEPRTYRAVLGFDQQSHGQMPGTIVAEGDVFHLCCRGGRVQLLSARRAR